MLSTKDDLHQKVCVVTVTCYPNLSDIRFQLALDLCQLASQLKITLWIVDNSPNHAIVRDKFIAAGKVEGGLASNDDGFIHVERQDTTHYAGKGGALRQGIKSASSWLDTQTINTATLFSPPTTTTTAILYMEPEKVDLLNHIHHIVEPILSGNYDVVVPTRNEELFHTTYPKEQFHSEMFGNMHFNNLAKQVAGFQGGWGEKPTKLDWLFGPFAFHTRHSDSWLNYTGTSWDAQMIPYVRGVKNQYWKITSVTVDFCHPKVMKEQEEGDPVFTSKRLGQLNLLFDLLGTNELSP
jgi:hypothetical protein